MEAEVVDDGAERAWGEAVVVAEEDVVAAGGVLETVIDVRDGAAVGGVADRVELEGAFGLPACDDVGGGVIGAVVGDEDIDGGGEVGVGDGLVVDAGEETVEKMKMTKTRAMKMVMERTAVMGKRNGRGG